MVKESHWEVMAEHTNSDLKIGFYPIALPKRNGRLAAPREFRSKTKNGQSQDLI